ncbi:MAG: DmsE family decaheme c-type cytochrome [Planctomycetes bacterium]|nr:DmsE family decaheme c-type cytochrome [Planctomycetota bacterium]
MNRTRRAHWVGLAALAAAATVAVASLASCTGGKQPQEPEAWVTIPGATYAEADACVMCHDKVAEGLGATRHGKKNDPNTPAAKNNCQDCHGPGSVHVANRQEDKPYTQPEILTFKEGGRFPSAQQTAQCLACHERGKSEWHATQHSFYGVGCASCHSVHDAKGERNLKLASVVETCARCHKDIKAALQRPSHHPIREGKVTCTNCHDPHGTGNEKLLAGTNANDACFRCHQEKRGPFLWAHAPVFENCLNCHTPHGSNNRTLLVSKPPQLCQQCHSDAQHPGTLFDATTLLEGDFPNAHAVHRACLDCHMRIHGSNHPSGKFFMR